MHTTPCFTGLGHTHPDPSCDVTVDDVKIPMGKGVPAGVDASSLLYNEYIVYDTAQVCFNLLIPFLAWVIMVFFSFSYFYNLSYYNHFSISYTLV